MPSEAKWAISLAIGVGLVWLGWKYTPLLVTLHIVVCLILVLVIMLQSGSAADLAGAFGGAGSQTAFGPRGAATLLSKATTWCAIIFMLTSLTLSVKRSPGETAPINSIFEQSMPASKTNQNAQPKAPVQPPAQNKAPQSPAQQGTPPKK
jgi:preprotein translocase subunit SecG